MRLSALCAQAYGPRAEYDLNTKPPYSSENPVRLSHISLFPRVICLVSDENEAALSTSSGERLFPFVRARLPLVSQLIVDVGIRQVEQCGDGGLLATGLCAALVEEMPRHPCASTAALYSLAATIASEQTDAPPYADGAAFQRCDGARDMIAVVAGVVGSHRNVCRFMTDEDVAHVSTMIVKAFVSAIDERFATPMVRFVPVSPSADSTLLRVLDGLLVDRPPPRVNDISPPPPHEGLSVALFSASLAGDWEGAERELALRQASVQVEGTRARLEPALLARLLHIADSLVHCGCRLVASQKCVHPRMRQRLVHAGVMVLERLSVRHMDGMARVSGARVVGDVWSDGACVCSGRVACVSPCRVPGGGEQTLVQGFAVSTVLVAGVDRAATDELERLCARAVRVLRCALAQPRLVTPGAVEMSIAKRLREFSTRSLLTRDDAARYSGASLAESRETLERVARALERLAERVQPHTMEEDAEELEEASSSSFHVRDVHSVRLQAISRALDTAAFLANTM